MWRVFAEDLILFSWFLHSQRKYTVLFFPSFYKINHAQVVCNIGVSREKRISGHLFPQLSKEGKHILKCFLSVYSKFPGSLLSEFTDKELYCVRQPLCIQPLSPKRMC